MSHITEPHHEVDSLGRDSNPGLCSLQSDRLPVRHFVTMNGIIVHLYSTENFADEKMSNVRIGMK